MGWIRRLIAVVSLGFLGRGGGGSVFVILGGGSC